jgi:iron complex outermembrane receptor protein
MARSPGGRRGRFLAVVAALAMGPAICGADAPAAQEDLSNLDLEALAEVPVVVVAAGKREQTSREAAASVSVVDSEQIDLLGHRNIAEILRNQRGFYLHTDGLNWFAGVRGFLRPNEWNARISVLTDGRPNREIIYGGSLLDQELTVPVEAIKRVEIIRGPGSALYGAGAVFGVVNVVTKDGADLNGGTLRVEGGMHETARIAALYGMRTDSGWDLVGALAAMTSQGESDIRYDGVDDPFQDFGHVRGDDAEDATAGFLKARKGDFTASFELGHRDRDNRSATYLASFFDPGTMHEQRINATLRFDHEVTEGQSVHAMLYYGSYNYRQWIGYGGDPATDPDFSDWLSSSEAQWLGQEVHYDWQLSKRLHLLFGADAVQDLGARQRDRDDFGTLLVIDESYNAWGVFAEAELKAADWLTLIAGLRVDRIQDVGSAVNPRGAGILRLSESDTLKLLYGRSFRPPNIYEMTYFSPGSYIGNPDLEPETIDTYEVVWERQFASGWRLSLGGFYWRMADSMDEVVIDSGEAQSRNTATTSARGLEVEVQRRWQCGGSLRAYATYTRAEDEDGDHLLVSPEWTAGAALVVPVFKKTFLSIDAQAVGAMESDLGEKTDPTFITNAVLTSRDFLGVRNLDFRLAAYHLFSDDARLPHGDSFQHTQPTLNWPETRVMAGLTYRF